MASIRCQCGVTLAVSPRDLGKPIPCGGCKAVLWLTAPVGPLEEGDLEFLSRLVIDAGPSRLDEQILLGGPGPIDIGSVSSNAVVLKGPKVSREHARLTRRGKDWILADKLSTNGTLVNNKRISETTLQHGDRIRIGDYTLLYSIAATVNAPAPSAPLKSADDGEYAQKVALVMEPADKTPIRSARRRSTRASDSPRSGQVPGLAVPEPAPGDLRLGPVLAAAKWIVPCLLVVALLAYWFLSKSTFVLTPGSRVKHPPTQTPILNGKPWRSGGYTITPLADFTLESMVLSKAAYNDPYSSVSKWNLVMGWGAMSDPAVVSNIKVLQESRGVQVSFLQPPDIDPNALKAQLAVLIIIPADEEVLTQIDALAEQSVVTLRGKLVSVDMPDGQVFTSNLIRIHDFTGQAEVMWVESVTPSPAHATPQTAPAPASP